jgi:hypothetical protein
LIVPLEAWKGGPNDFLENNGEDVREGQRRRFVFSIYFSIYFVVVFSIYFVVTKINGKLENKIELVAAGK